MTLRGSVVLTLGIIFLGFLGSLFWLMAIPEDVPREELSGPVGIVVPHHDMVASARAAYMAQVAKERQPKTIVLLSPDHFNRAQQPMVTTRRSWETATGQVLPDTDLIAALALPEAGDEAFLSEHGVTSLLAELHENFPEARLVPILINRSATYAKVTELVDALFASCADCLLVASVDFSHTVESNVAALHDRRTLRELAQGNAPNLYKYVEADSPETLAALALWAGRHKASRFELFAHTNSGVIAATRVGEMTTHIMGGYERGERVTMYDNEVTMLFGGDVMFAGRVAADHARSPGRALVAGLGERFFWGVDGAMVNLEGAFSTRANREVGWKQLPPQLLFAPEYVEALRSARLTHAGRANNHAADGGEGATVETDMLLDSVRIRSIGNGDRNTSASYFTAGSTTVAVVAFSALRNPVDMVGVVRREREQGHRVVVYMHWGTEYEEVVTPEQQVLARELVAAGAELIVGSHPQVVQDVAVVSGVPVVYSLGNLLFDPRGRSETETGAVVGVTFIEEGIELFLVPVASYPTPTVLSDDIGNVLLQEWVAAWQGYKQPSGSYFFPRRQPE